MKLELKHVASYLPYELKFIDKVANKQFDALSWIINGASQPHNSGFKNNLDQLLRDQELKILLRPLSALTEQLPDGTIPIVELAKIAKFTFTESDKINITDVAINIRDDKYLFGFNFNWNSFHSYSLCDQNPINVKHQLQLFEYLFTNHFDVFNLISCQLADAK